MRPVDKTNPKNQTTYDPYGGAKQDLIDTIGGYCSYCERKGHFAALAVEHVEDKKNNPTKKNLWSNFLLACTNCNSIKGKKDVEFNTMLFPHLNNTFSAFEYLEGGLLLVEPNYHTPDNATALMELVGLDRRPGHANYSDRDKRWEERRKASKKAEHYLEKVENGLNDIAIIVDLATETGFFSIWMHTFKNHPNIQDALMKAHPGTSYQAAIKAHLQNK